jgi:ubiquinone/menaquinone biosynthesis C-methylase UbiE
VASRVDYDQVSASYDQRYERYAYPGVEQAVVGFAASPDTRVLEVGCGTGFWLGLLHSRGVRVTGLDPSTGMLQKARARVPSSELVHGRAEQLPFESARFDRVLCANAFHHFEDKRAFLREAARVLAPGGGLMIVGLDPHTGTEDWCVYDYFEGTLRQDRERYVASPQLCALMAEAGLVRCESALAHAIADARDARQALGDGSLAKATTSQLTILSDAEYDAGIAAIRKAADLAEARGESLTLRANLEMHACTGFMP